MISSSYDDLSRSLFWNTTISNNIMSITKKLSI